MPSADRFNFKVPSRGRIAKLGSRIGFREQLKRKDLGSAANFDGEIQEERFVSRRNNLKTGSRMAFERDQGEIPGDSRVINCRGRQAVARTPLRWRRAIAPWEDSRATVV